MAYIELRFYQIWKQMSVEGVGVNERERARLAVWDYPVSDRYTKILHQMHLTGLPLSFEEGIKRVKASKSAQEGFAFLADATKVRYAVMIDCDLRQVGNEFSRKPLALAVPENSTLKDELSSAILKLLNRRKLEELKERWYVQTVKKNNFWNFCKVIN
jgi:ionotropic glutamate receptor